MSEQDRQDARPSRSASEEPPAEAEESLWWLTAPPAVWLAHLLACYLTAANFCAKASEHASLEGVRIAIGAYTAVALAALAWLAGRGISRHRHPRGESFAPHDFDSRAARHRFLGFTLLLLAGAGILGVVFVALPALFMETCR